MAKKLFARQRFYSPIILREEKEPVVKVWGYYQTVYETLLKKRPFWLKLAKPFVFLVFQKYPAIEDVEVRFPENAVVVDRSRSEPQIPKKKV